MKQSRLLKVGVLGAAAAAICCFTPLLMMGLGAIGLSAWVGYLDSVLIPVLISFIGLSIYAMLRKGSKTEDKDERNNS